ncbi:MAG: DUF2336 domain-containing protein [Alphaproteobacteria bacterium]|nr:DUF2336 domain-containing protein [Alphaproteobacteria bacterium]
MSDAPGRAEATPLDYEVSKRLAASEDPGTRRELARRRDLKPEILYYLAEDHDSEVRREVARNADAPRHADLLLAKDADNHVRGDLAAKIGRLLPDLDGEARDAASRLTVQVVETLARDALTQIRRVVAEAIKANPAAPPHVVQALARDREISVAAPVLEFSPVLSDEDLLEIIASTPIQGAIAAIARRAGLGGDVSHAVVDTGDVPAIAALLNNQTAQIREETLDLIVDRAPGMQAWHAPLARRRGLPQRAARRIAEFVARELLDELSRRTDLDADTKATVSRAITERFGAPHGGPVRVSQPPRGGGRVTAADIAVALAENRTSFVISALASMADLPETGVSNAVRLRNHKALAAAAWRARLDPQTTVLVQTQLCGVPPRMALRPGRNGEPPMDERELAFQIDLLTGAKPAA